MTAKVDRVPRRAGQGDRKRRAADNRPAGPQTTYLGDWSGWNWAIVAEKAGAAIASSVPLVSQEEEAAAVAEAQAAAGAAGHAWVLNVAKATAEVVQDARRQFRGRVREAQDAGSYTTESWGREIGARLNVERYGRLAAYWNRVAALMQAEQGGGS